MSELAAVDRLLCVPRPETKHGPWAPALALSLLMHSAGAAALLYRSTPQAQAFEAIEVEVITANDLAKDVEIPTDVHEGPAEAEIDNEMQSNSLPMTAKPSSDPSHLEEAASSEANPDIVDVKREPEQPAERVNDMAQDVVASAPPAPVAVATSAESEAATERKNAAAKAFFAAVSAELNRRRIYPAAARQRGLVGAVKVVFTIGVVGRVVHFDIIKSSGHRLLDDAVGKIMASMQTPPPPEGPFTTAVTVRFDLR